ncbi:MAG: TIGR02147 family protein [Fibrobacter sp.]|nr:TIGR02147 family protein [Fibrobacter sp.]
MKSIFEFYDYRLYMRSFYEEQKRTSVFSWRAFSKLAGFSSPNYIKVVCDGKSRLSKAGVEQVASAMGLVEHEKIYFQKLVEFNEAPNEARKKNVLQQIQEIAKEYKIKMLDADAFMYFESWLNPVLRELAPMNPGAKPLSLSKLCIPETSATEVRHSIDFLVHAGILQKTKDNHYRQTEKIVSGSSEVMPLALRSMHRQMANLACKAIDDIPVSKRYFSGITIAVSEAEYKQIIEELEIFRQRILRIASGVKQGRKVCRLNLQFFPLTKSKEEIYE